MKAKLRLLEVGILTIVIILDAYLINSNTKVSEYQTRATRSTANYIDVTNVDLEEQKKQFEQQDLANVYNNVKEKREEVIDDKKVEEKVEEPIIVAPAIVYDGMTLEQLTTRINNSLNSTVSGKGHLIASYSLEKGVDPYIATAIMLHETGCQSECSRLVKECNNVGGQKGSGCGSYSAFPSLEEGIKAFIDNIYKNYVSYGLTTPEAMNSKYAADKNWSVNVNKYIEIIKTR